MTRTQKRIKLLQPTVLAYVKHYTEDFTKHDREYLEREDPDQFILALRETGTNICSLDDWDERTDEGKKNGAIWLLGYNQIFIHVQGLTWRIIEREDVEDMLALSLDGINDIRHKLCTPKRTRAIKAEYATL